LQELEYVNHGTKFAIEDKPKIKLGGEINCGRNYLAILGISTRGEAKMKTISTNIFDRK
jgi:hypothetical protein